MVNQYESTIHAVHIAARTHTQKSKGAVGPAVDYRLQGEALPVISADLTSELLHCLSTLPDPWPLAKITIDMEKPSQWVSKLCRLYFADEYAKRTVGLPSRRENASFSNAEIARFQTRGRIVFKRARRIVFKRVQALVLAFCWILVLGSWFLVLGFCCFLGLAGSWFLGNDPIFVFENDPSTILGPVQGVFSIRILSFSSCPSSSHV